MRISSTVGESAVHVIAVLNQKGGAGKTTIATHLARALQIGGADVLLIDSVVGNYYIAQQDDPTQFTVLPEVLEAEEYGIAFRKGEQTLADAVSQQLIDMFKDGTLDTIRAKWFANDITMVAQYAN